MCVGVQSGHSFILFKKGPVFFTLVLMDCGPFKRDSDKLKAHGEQQWFDFERDLWTAVGEQIVKF